MNPRAGTTALALVTLASLVLGGVWVVRGRVEAVSLRPDDAQAVQRGKSVYVAQCAACHGERLEGQPDWRRRRANGRLPAPPHDANGHTWHHADELLVRLTKHGPATVAGPDYETDMPAFEGILSDEQILDVLSYIKSTWPPDVRDTHDDINAQARR